MTVGAESSIIEEARATTRARSVGPTVRRNAGCGAESAVCRSVSATLARIHKSVIRGWLRQELEGRLRVRVPYGLPREPFGDV